MKIETANLHALLDRLRLAGIRHQLRHDREGAVTVDIVVPGERWELDVLEDGTVEIEIFKSDGTIHGASKLSELFASYSD